MTLFRLYGLALVIALGGWHYPHYDYLHLHFSPLFRVGSDFTRLRVLGCIYARAPDLRNDMVALAADYPHYQSLLAASRLGVGAEGPHRALSLCRAAWWGSHLVDMPLAALLCGTVTGVVLKGRNAAEMNGTELV